MKRWYKYIKPYLPFFILGPLCMIVGDCRNKQVGGGHVFVLSHEETTKNYEGRIL